MARGRKPKPMSLKILEGVRHAERLNFAEPNFPAGPLDPPDWLDRYGVEQWNELVPLLSGVGIFTAADRPAMVELCEAYSQIRNKTANREVHQRYLRLLCEFGLTPSSRSRLRSTADRPGDALQEFLTRKNG